jgi:hypothetical protein
VQAQAALRIGLLEDEDQIPFDYGQHPLTTPLELKTPIRRGIALGLTLAVGVNAIIPYTQHAIRTTSLVESTIPMGVLIPFLFFVFIINPILGRFSNLRFTSRELVVAFAISFVPAHVNEVLGRVIGASSVMHYMASPENGWAEFVFERVPPWLMVPDAGEPVSWFHEGLPTGQSIPWNLYVTPLLWWLSFLSAIGLGCIALGSIMRSQWVDRERIPFPFARVIEDLAGTHGQEARHALVHGRLFWIGFAIPAFVILWYMFSYSRPDFPIIRLGILGTNYSLGRHLPRFRAHIYFPMVGFAYFTDLSVLLSIWVFYILTWSQIGVSSRLGLAEGLGQYAGATQQGFGGFIVFCGWTLWIARDHLRNVFSRGAALTTSIGELHTHRSAATLLASCALFMMFWLGKSGMQPILAIVVVLFWFLFYAGFAKVVATTGLVFVESPGLGLRITRYLPTRLMTPETLAIRRIVDTTYQNGKCFAASNAAHAARLAYPLGEQAKTVGRVTAIGLVLALVAAAFSTVYLGHLYGASNFSSNSFSIAPSYLNLIVSDIRNIGHDPNYGLKMTYVIGGALTMAALTLCRYRFAWWPLDPIGFTLVTLNSVQRSILSVFLAWLSKSIILHLGGIALYKRWQPFFIGLIVGNAFGLAVGIVVDVIYYPGAGHNLYFGD